jgi:hypothetical protein
VRFTVDAVRASENVGKLKQETMKFMGEYLQQHNMTAEEGEAGATGCEGV